MNSPEVLKRTALFELHRQAGAKIVPFAGYAMPVHYAHGIIREHLHTREKAGLFDVSHMGQIRVCGPDAAQLLETLMPVDIVSLPRGRQKYGLLLNASGGIIDDLMVTRTGQEDYLLVVNAARKDFDLNHIRARLPDSLEVEMQADQSLLALQGPRCARVMEKLGHDLSNMRFMQAQQLKLAGVPCWLSRSGYTGEDGFEISVDDNHAAEIAACLLKDDDVQWVGLGARDSLRLEAGLCLYGHDITEHTTPIEASLLWAVSKARRTGGPRPGGFVGDDIVLAQIPRNVAKRLVGFSPAGRALIRPGAVIEDMAGRAIGQVTSGGFSPSLGRPVCMGYAVVGQCSEHNRLNAVVRDKRLPVAVTKLPFVSPNYYHGPAVNQGRQTRKQT